MLKTLKEDHKSSWKEHVSKLVYAYNRTKNSTTGYSPFFLLFGRKPKPPIDLFLPDTVNQERNRNNFVTKFRRQIEETYKIAADKSINRKQKDIQRHSNQIQSLSALQLGERALIRNLSKREGTGKLRSYWEPVVHTAIKGKGENSVTYTIQPKNDPKRKISYFGAIVY